MQTPIRFRNGEPLKEVSDALLVPVATGDDGWRGIAQAVDEGVGGTAKGMAQLQEFAGELESVVEFPTYGSIGAKRVILVGVGDREQPNADRIRRSWAAATKKARGLGAKKLQAVLPPGGDVAESLRLAVEGLVLPTYEFSKYYGTVRNEKPGKRIDEIEIIGSNIVTPELTESFNKALSAVRAQAIAQDLISEPANAIDPETLQQRAEEIAKDAGLKFTVLDVAALEERGAGAILGVGKGSAVPPRLLHLVYTPEGETDGPPIGLVGKAITFDTGGYSIKTGEGMVTMKTDMAGGAAVLGAMSALREQGVKREVHAVICVAENMISGEAFHPGDVLTASNGVTIEVISTDAEGRLVLADGMVYMAEQGVSEMIDLATLTGGAVVALGDKTTALFANDDRLAEDLLAAAEDTGEAAWRMPLAQAYQERIKGDIADIKNSGGRQASSVTAALFLEHFTQGLPWAHFDIAGTARAASAYGYTSKGATGTGVRTLLSYLTRNES